MRRTRVAMVVYNELRHDARVHKEASSLADAGYLVKVIGVRDENSPEIPGWERFLTERLTVGPVKTLRLRYLQFWAKAFRKLMRLKPDVIHSHDLDALPACWLAARLLGAPVVFDSHEYWTEMASIVGRPRIQAIWRLLGRVFIPRVDRSITVCESIAEELNHRYGVWPIVLRNMPPRRGLPVARDVRGEIGIDEETPLVLYQGTMTTGVGIERCIAMMEHLPEAHLLLLGGGPLREEFEGLRELSPVKDRITFAGPVPFSELLTWTAAADIGLFLGESDGLSIQYALTNKFFEYIQAGVPVVVTGYPEHSRHVHQYGVGKIVTPGSPPSHAAEVVRQALAERDSLARNCNLARHELVWETDAVKLLDLYGHLPIKKK